MFKVYGYDSNIHKCVYCDNAKRLLTVKKQPFEFINIMTEKGVFDDEKIAELLTKLGRDTQIGLTMPQVFAPDGSHIGGFDQLREYFK